MSSRFLSHVTLSNVREYPAIIYLFKVNNRNARNRCEICSKLIIKTPKWRQRLRFDVFIVNFEHISHLFILLLFLTLNKYMLADNSVETTENRVFCWVFPRFGLNMETYYGDFYIPRKHRKTVKFSVVFRDYRNVRYAKMQKKNLSIWIFLRIMILLRFVLHFKNSKQRSSHRRCSLRKGVLRNFAKFAGKHLCQSLFFNKATGLRPARLLKKRLWHLCFPLNFAKFIRTLFLQNTSGQLLLKTPSNKNDSTLIWNV